MVSVGEAHGLSFPTLISVLFTRNLISIISFFREKQCLKLGIKSNQTSRKGPYTAVLGTTSLLSVLEGVKQSRQCAPNLIIFQPFYGTYFEEKNKDPMSNGRICKL